LYDPGKTVGPCLSFSGYEKEKPGILEKLPPFLDDIIGGLISGVLVKVRSKNFLTFFSFMVILK